MKLMQPVSALALVLALGAGGLVTSAAYAATPTAPAKIAVMDTNKNGRIEKSEYLAYMSSAFDKTAGAKGYCSYEEIEKGFDDMRNRGLYVN